MKFTKKQLEIMTKPQLRKLRKDLVAILNNPTQSPSGVNIKSLPESMKPNQTPTPGIITGDRDWECNCYTSNGEYWHCNGAGDSWGSQFTYSSCMTSQQVAGTGYWCYEANPANGGECVCSKEDCAKYNLSESDYDGYLNYCIVEMLDGNNVGTGCFINLAEWFIEDKLLESVYGCVDPYWDNECDGKQLLRWLGNNVDGLEFRGMSRDGYTSDSLVLYSDSNIEFGVGLIYLGRPVVDLVSNNPFGFNIKLYDARIDFNARVRVPGFGWKAIDHIWFGAKPTTSEPGNYFQIGATVTGDYDNSSQTFTIDVDFPEDPFFNNFYTNFSEISWNPITWLTEFIEILLNGIANIAWDLLFPDILNSAISGTTSISGRTTRTSYSNNLAKLIREEKALRFFAGIYMDNFNQINLINNDYTIQDWYDTIWPSYPDYGECVSGFDNDDYITFDGTGCWGVACQDGAYSAYTLPGTYGPNFCDGMPEYCTPSGCCQQGYMNPNLVALQTGLYTNIYTNEIGSTEIFKCGQVINQKPPSTIIENIK